MKLILVFFAIAFLATTLTAGTITGKVRAESRPEVKEDIDAGKYDILKYKFFERINYDEITDFIVYIDQDIPGSVRPPAKPLQVVIQKNATFKPHILPLLAGTTVEWPNHDDIYHNVFSISEAKPFDLGFYKHNEIKRMTFDKPGRVDVFCSIHTKMNCTLLVLATPFFASTDKEGHYQITDVPAGTYKLRAWHERLPSQIKEITVPENGDVNVDFVLSVSGLPKY